jgi:hypothetical protein
LYCTSAWIGSIDVETVQNGQTVVLSAASYQVGSADTGCHVLQAGGYFPNQRATIAPSGSNTGTISVWYSASAAPISFAAAGVDSSGPTSPVVCDQATFAAIGTGTSGAIVPGVGTFLLPGTRPVICGFTISFSGATGTGFVDIAWFTTSACSSSSVTTWALTTLASTPQALVVPLRQQPPAGTLTNPVPCVVNTSGATVTIALSYANITPH